MKLNEISDIDVECYTAGELKDCSVAQIDKSVPVIVTASHDAIFEKTASKGQEVADRDGRIIMIGDARGAAVTGLGTLATLTMPDVDRINAPFVYTVPIQLIAYRPGTFTCKGHD